MANDLTFTQTAAIMNGILQQITGQESLAPINTDEFINVAQTALLAGYDRVLGALSQQMNKTLFRVQPYKGHFGLLSVTNEEFGNHTRKVNYLADKFEDNQARPQENLNPDDPMGNFDDGNSVDRWKIHKGRVIQTNFYGGQTYQKHLTRFKNQIDVAFKDAAEASKFFAGILTEANNDIEQMNEGSRQACIANIIAALYTFDQADYRKESVVHLISEYNTLTGQSLTYNDVMKADNYIPFMEWVLTRMDAISNRMSVRSYLYHNNLTTFTSKTVALGEGLIPRFTNPGNVKSYIFSEYLTALEMRVKSNVHHPDFLKMGKSEGIVAFQNLNSPDSVNVVPVWTDTAGGVQTGAMQDDGTGDGDDVTVNKIFGLIVDDQMCGHTIVDEWSMATPLNEAGGYSNIFWHWTNKYWADFTENAVLFLMD